MITLITGTPGAGKTLYAVSEEIIKIKDRPLYIDGIPDLAIDHLTPTGEVDRWHEWVPDGSVLVIDEVQRIWRPRGTATAVPAGVAAMETHRHKGVDIILITQHPNLLDPNIRRLVGRHIHVRRMFGWNRAIVYEWDSATDPARVTTALKRSWSYPRKAFKLYKSSSLHTARTNRVPVVFVVMILAGLAVPAMGYVFFSGTVGTWTSDTPDASASDAATELATARSAGAAPAASYVMPASIIEATTPTDPHNPLSAPLYAASAPPVTPPQVVGCIASSRSCSCYSQQATPVWLPEEQCRQRAAGAYYDPYRVMPQPREETKTATAAKAVAPATEVQALPASEMPAAMF